MKQLYSIGETAKIIGISTQALRSYSNMNLVAPEEVNLDTGYRYYSFKQLHYIDRIKYLRQLGLSLKDIADILNNGKPDKMLFYLKQKKSDLTKQILDISNKIEEIDWYIDYFHHLNEIHMPTVPYIRQFPERYILYVPYTSKNPKKDYLAQENKECMEISMMKLKNSKAYPYRRQWGITIDFEQYLTNKFVPINYFFFLKEKPTAYSKNSMEHIKIIPAGLYLCLWCKQKLQIQTNLVNQFYSMHQKPSYALALEYENSFISYENCPYEYQTLIQPANDEKI